MASAFAERLITKFGEKWLSIFLKNFTREHIRLHVLSGQGELTNLDVNTQAVQELMDVPQLEVKQIKVNRVYFNAQVTKLKSQPISITIDRVDLVLAEPEQAVRHEHKLVQPLVDLISRAKSRKELRDAKREGKKEKLTYGLGDKIGDSIRVDVSHVHVALQTLGTRKTDEIGPWTPPMLVLDLYDLSVYTTDSRYRIRDLREIHEEAVIGDMVHVFKEISVGQVNMVFVPVRYGEDSSASRWEPVPLVKGAPCRVRMHAQRALGGGLASMDLDIEMTGALEISLTPEQLPVAVHGLIGLLACLYRSDVPKRSQTAGESGNTDDEVLRSVRVKCAVSVRDILIRLLESVRARRCIEARLQSVGIDVVLAEERPPQEVEVAFTIPSLTLSEVDAPVEATTHLGVRGDDDKSRSMAGAEDIARRESSSAPSDRTHSRRGGVVRLVTPAWSALAHDTAGSAGGRERRNNEEGAFIKALLTHRWPLRTEELYSFEIKASIEKPVVHGQIDAWLHLFELVRHVLDARWLIQGWDDQDAPTDLHRLLLQLSLPHRFLRLDVSVRGAEIRVAHPKTGDDIVTVTVDALEMRSVEGAGHARYTPEKIQSSELARGADPTHGIDAPRAEAGESAVPSNDAKETMREAQDTDRHLLQFLHSSAEPQWRDCRRDVVTIGVFVENLSVAPSGHGRDPVLEDLNLNGILSLFFQPRFCPERSIQIEAACAASEISVSIARETYDAVMDLVAALLERIREFLASETQRGSSGPLVAADLDLRELEDREEQRSDHCSQGHVLRAALTGGRDWGPPCLLLLHVPHARVKLRGAPPLESGTAVPDVLIEVGEVFGRMTHFCGLARHYSVASTVQFVRVGTGRGRVIDAGCRAQPLAALRLDLRIPRKDVVRRAFTRRSSLGELLTGECGSGDTTLDIDGADAIEFLNELSAPGRDPTGGHGAASISIRASDVKRATNASRNADQPADLGAIESDSLKEYDVPSSLRLRVRGITLQTDGLVDLGAALVHFALPRLVPVLALSLSRDHEGSAPASAREAIPLQHVHVDVTRVGVALGQGAFLGIWHARANVELPRVCVAVAGPPPGAKSPSAIPGAPLWCPAANASILLSGEHPHAKVELAPVNTILDTAVLRACIDLFRAEGAAARAARPVAVDALRRLGAAGLVPALPNSSSEAQGAKTKPIDSEQAIQQANDVSDVLAWAEDALNAVRSSHEEHERLASSLSEVSISSARSVSSVSAIDMLHENSMRAMRDAGLTKSDKKQISLRVSGHESVHRRESEFVEYILDVEVDEEQWSVRKRYSDFMNLRRQLVRECPRAREPTAASQAFSLKQRARGRNLSDAVLRERKALLDDYCRGLAQHPLFSQSPTLAQFIGCEEHRPSTAEQRPRLSSSDGGRNESSIEETETVASGIGDSLGEASSALRLVRGAVAAAVKSAADAENARIASEQRRAAAAREAAELREALERQRIAHERDAQLWDKVAEKLWWARSLAPSSHAEATAAHTRVRRDSSAGPSVNPERLSQLERVAAGIAALQEQVSNMSRERDSLARELAEQKQVMEALRTPGTKRKVVAVSSARSREVSKALEQQQSLQELANRLMMEIRDKDAEIEELQRINKALKDHITSGERNA